MIAEPMTLRPTGARLLVRFLAPADRTSGGIWLPETMQENYSEAEVLATGPGEWVPELEIRRPPWVSVGDTVLLRRKQDCRMVGGPGSQMGMVKEEDLLGVTLPSGDLLPLGNWVMVKPEPRPKETASGIALSDLTQRWRSRGTVLDYGPGLPTGKGIWEGVGRTVHQLLNLPDDFPLVGAVVVWQKNAAIYQVGREVVDSWLVDGSDIIALEIPD